MANRARLYAQLLADLSASPSAGAARSVDLAVSLCVADVDGIGENARWRPGSEEELLRVGGRWDRRHKAWSGEATEGVVLRVHRGQEAAARWLAKWFRCKLTGDWRDFRRVWSGLLVGGRRSGKTHLAAAALVLYATAFPSAVVWAVSPTLERSAEIERALLGMIPRAWYRRVEQAGTRTVSLRFVNGSRIELRSGHKASGMKAGRVDFALLNEAQLLDHKAFVNLRGGVTDRGGLVLAAANPPDEPVGMWVEEYFRGVAAGEIEGVTFEFDPRRNPFVEYASLAALAAETDERTFMRDVLGLFTPIGDVVMHAWSQIESLREPPSHFRDITADVTRRELGRPFPHVIGVDLQRSPAIVGAVFVVLEDPAAPGVELAWVVDEVWCEPGDENDFIDLLQGLARWRPAAAVRDDGDRHAPDNTAVIMDASAWWQDSAHHKGQESNRKLAARGWRHLYRPQKDSDKNPDILERMKAGNMLLKAANGVRRMFVSPRCARIATALRLYENKHGKPNRQSAHAHAVDAVTYVAYRMFGRAKPTGKIGAYWGAGRFTRGEMFPR